MTDITWSDKSDGDGTTASTRVSAADMNEVKAAANSKLDRDALPAGIEGVFSPPATGVRVAVWSEGAPGTIEGLSGAPTGMFDLLAGQSDTEGALWDWLSGIRTGAIISNVVTLEWPDDASEHPAITIVEAAADFTLVLPVLGAEMVAQGARRYRRHVYVRNVGIPAITIMLGGAASGRIPLRGSSPIAGFGRWSLLTIDYATPLGFASVSFSDLGPSVPPYILKLADAHTNNVQVGSFNPYVYATDPVLLFMSRNTGSAAVFPSGKNYAWATGAGLTDGGVANGTANGSRLAISDTRSAAGAFGGTGSVSNNQHVAAVAYRGVEVDECAGLVGISTTVSWPGFTSVPDGSFAVYFTASNTTSHIEPPGSVSIHTSDTVAVGGWSWTTRRVDAVAGSIAPAPVTIASAAWHTIGCLLVPEV